MTRVLILTTAVGYKAEQLLPFQRSLDLCGYQGDITYLVDTPTADNLEPHLPPNGKLLVFDKMTPQDLITAAPAPLKEKITSGVNLVAPAFLNECLGINFDWALHFIASFNHPAVYRYLFYTQHVFATQDQYDAYILCDSRDILFQRNPSDVLYDGMGLHTGIEKETTRLGLEEWNTKWIHQLYGEAGVEKYYSQPIACSGATLGDKKAILDYLQKMFGEMVLMTHRSVGQFGLDQAMHNRLWYDGLLPQIQPNYNFHSEIATLNDYTAADLLPRCKDGVLYREDTHTPIMLVHQYDRIPELASLLLDKIGLVQR